MRTRSGPICQQRRTAGIDHGLFATAVGGWISNADELPGLDRQQGQRHGADTLDLQQRSQQLSCAGGEEVAGPANFTQHCSEVGRDHGHEACMRNWLCPLA